MKPLKTIGTVALIGLVASCNQQVEIETLMGNPDTRQEIYQAISGNYEHVKEYTHVLMNDSETRDLLGTDPKMIDYLINNDGLDKLLKENPTAEEHIMDLLLQDSTMTNIMFNKALIDDDNLLRMAEYLKNKDILPKGCQEQLQERIKEGKSKK
ncbi:hypothetical protein [Flagellimonas beolgyonensis]|uniref:hypothetical protein n=1 Tax=Flagellimonas beolgyonensis TaxID=864064 RepID=UPI003D64E099